MDIAKNHFELFGLPAHFAIDVGQLETAYRQVLAEVHPDRFAAGGAAEKRVALQWSTQANEAYRTLRDATARARYLAELRGVALEVETNTAMPAAFLMEQMELRESLEAAAGRRDREALVRLQDKLLASRSKALEHVSELLDQSGTSSEVAAAVRKLMFLDRFQSDVDDAVERLEND